MGCFMRTRTTRADVERMLSIVARRTETPMALDANSNKRVAVFTAYWRDGHLQLEERITEYLSTRECYAFLCGILAGLSGF